MSSTDVLNANNAATNISRFGMFTEPIKGVFAEKSTPLPSNSNRIPLASSFTSSAYTSPPWPYETTNSVFATSTSDAPKSNASKNKGTKKAPNSTVNNNKFINRLDKNGDGKISASEFKGSATRFKQFDKNGDGYITADEAPTGPPKNKK